MPRPTGTVTFLFTDIEGSTRLWEQHPEAMRSALARHDALLRQAIEGNNGLVFKTMGDAFCAAFHSATEGLAAALSAQRALVAEPWQEGLSLRVRMALHTGNAEERDGDYFGQPLNRVARLLAIGHGGQVLLSAATQTLVLSALPPEAALKDRGLHRLKDLQEPEHVFQLLAPQLPEEFAPLNSLNLHRHNLPVQLSSFIGREKQIVEVQALLARARLLTLTGSGGTGKSRLSLQVAADLVETYRDGVWLVELAAVSDAALVVQAVASVVNVREEPGKPLLQSLVEGLRGKQLLLVLDNCEHVLEAAASLAEGVLKQCPEVKILASSREGLGLSGEQTYRVPSLGLPPDPGQRRTVGLEDVIGSESVRLFAERAALVRPDFTLTPGNAPTLARLCHRLDGIPLALELAAARVRALPVEQIEARLQDRFRLLTGGSRTALPRQQTLRALIDWSYDLLSETERTLLRRLSVFMGGWTLEAAEAICAGEGIEEWEVLDLLTSLVDKSLVVYEGPEPSTRYRLLETIRQYARDRLYEAGDGALYRDRHRDWFLSLAEQAEPQLQGPEQALWLERLETEHDNLRAALEWSLAADGSAEAGLRLVGALWRFWEMRGYLTEGRAHLADALSHAQTQERTQERARALTGAGNLAWHQSDYEAARTLHEQSLAIYQALGNTKG